VTEAGLRPVDLKHAESDDRPRAVSAMIGYAAKMDREHWRWRLRIWRLFAVAFLFVGGFGFFLGARMAPTFGTSWQVSGAWERGRR